MTYAAVALAGLGLLVWLVLGTRYYYFDNARNVHYRDDGWTGVRQILRCTDERRGDRTVQVCRWVKGWAAGSESFGARRYESLMMTTSPVVVTNCRRAAVRCSGRRNTSRPVRSWSGHTVVTAA